MSSDPPTLYNAQQTETPLGPNAYTIHLFLLQVRYALITAPSTNADFPPPSADLLLSLCSCSAPPGPGCSCSL